MKPQTTPPPRTAVYLRVSTEEQQKEGISLDFQRRLCLDAATAAGCPEPVFFVDGGYSGTSLRRPALQDFLARLSEFDALYVYRLDRLSRSVRDWANLMGTLSEAGVGFVSVSERFDFSTPWGKAAMGMLAVFAELFIDILRANVRAAFDERALQGHQHGRRPLGYKLAATGKPRDPMEVDDATAWIITDLFSRYANGEPMNAITQSLYGTPAAENGTWTVGRVKHILTNPAYIGQIRWGDELYEGLHEPIIDRATWDIVQRRLRRNRTVAPQARAHTLCPVYRCGLCGGPVRVATCGQRKGVFRAYACDRRAKKLDGDHGPLTMSTTTADALTWALVRELVTGGQLREAAKRQAGARGQKREAAKQGKLLAEREELERAIAYNLQAARAGALPLDLLSEQQAPLLARRDQVLAELQRLGEGAEVVGAARLSGRDLEALIDGGDVERQRTLLLGLFSRVEIHRDRLVYVSRFEDLPPLHVARLRYTGHRDRRHVHLHIMDGG